LRSNSKKRKHSISAKGLARSPINHNMARVFTDTQYQVQREYVDEEFSNNMSVYPKLPAYERLYNESPSQKIAINYKRCYKK
jgi:aminoglycoside phosphotransferase